MGREIRRVPPNWEHPRQQCEHSPWSGGCSDAKRNGGQCYRPLFDRYFATAAKEWKDEFAAWERGERPSYCSADPDTEFWEYQGAPPDRDSYRPAWAEGAATWFQVYETVSEGTPVTPPFPTKEALIEYLVTTGDFWSDKPHSRAQAEAFVRDEYVPSMIIADGKMFVGIDSAGR